MREKPKGFPYVGGKKYLITGDLLNEIIQFTHGFQPLKGDINYESDGVTYEPEERFPSGDVKIESHIADPVYLEGEYFNGKFFPGGYREAYEGNTEGGQPAAKDVLAKSPDGTIYPDGEILLGVPVFESFNKDMYDEVFTDSDITLGVDENILVLVYHLAGGGAGGAIPAKITGLPTDGEYPVKFYADGKHQDYTGTGTVEVLNLAVSETLPVDTWIMAYRAAVSYNEGS